MDAKYKTLNLFHGGDIGSVVSSDSFYTMNNCVAGDDIVGMRYELGDVLDILTKRTDAAVATVNNKMNTFIISAGTLVDAQDWATYSAVYIKTQIPENTLAAALAGEIIRIGFDNTEREYNCHFMGEFVHVGGEFVFQEDAP